MAARCGALGSAVADKSREASYRSRLFFLLPRALGGGGTKAVANASKVVAGSTISIARFVDTAISRRIMMLYV